MSRAGWRPRLLGRMPPRAGCPASRGGRGRSPICRLSPPTSSPAQSSPPQPELLGRQKLSATTVKCPGISGGANLQLWPAPLSGTRFVRSGVVASGGRVATRVCGASSFLLPGWRGPRASVGENVLVGEWSWLVVTWRRSEPPGGSIGWQRPPGRTDANISRRLLSLSKHSALHHTV